MARSFVVGYDWGQAGAPERRGREPSRSQRERGGKVAVGGISPVTGERTRSRHHGAVRAGDIRSGVEADDDNVTAVGTLEHALIHYASFMRTGQQVEYDAAMGQVGQMNEEERGVFNRLKDDDVYMIRFGGLKPMRQRGRN